MARITLHKISDAIDEHARKEVVRIGGFINWYDFQPIMDMIEQYAADREWKAMQPAIGWWEGHRPVHYTLEEHLNNPTINCQAGREDALATAVAKAIRKRQKKGKK